MEAPFSALALAEVSSMQSKVTFVLSMVSQLASRVGFPPGVINVVTTGAHTKDVGKEICENHDVRKISFTGSTAVGKTLYAQSASTMKKMSLELGGNAPFVVFDDADIDQAIAGEPCQFLS